VIKGKPIGTIV